MIELCNIVVESLKNQGIKCQKLHPHKLNIKGTNADFEIDQFQIDQIFANNKVSVIHGDVVEVNGSKKFGILSGDDIAVKLIVEGKNKQYSKLHMIFAMTNAPGVMSLPPDNPKVCNFKKYFQ